MPKKKETKKTSSSPLHNPTPWLGLPRPDRKLFTYSENQLLDQLTTEIMHAWAKDLNILKDYYHKITTSGDALERISELMVERFSSLNKFLDNEKFSSLYNQLTTHYGEVNARLADINKRMIELENWMQFPYVLKLQDSIKILSDKADLLIHQNTRKSLWKRMFKRKTQNGKKQKETPPVI